MELVYVLNFLTQRKLLFFPETQHSWDMVATSCIKTSACVTMTKNIHLDDYLMKKRHLDVYLNQQT